MNAKITKRRLKNMLSYDWWKILLTALALIFSWALIFNATATKIIPSQKFVIANYVGSASLPTRTLTNLEDQLKNGKLTHEIIETEDFDLSTAQAAASSVLETRVAVNELDLMFVSPAPDNTTAYEHETETGEIEILYGRTYLESFLSGYDDYLHNLSLTDEEGYFKRLEGYLNRYYTNGFADDSVLDTAKIEEDFRARAKGDKRYKKEAKIKKGVQGEIERVQKYRQALLAFYGYVEAGRVEIVNTPLLREDGSDERQGKGTLSINICKKEEDSALLSPYVGYYVEYLNENGISQYKKSALNMQVCLFDSNGEEDSHRYEGLVYLTNFLGEVYGANA